MPILKKRRLDGPASHRKSTNVKSRTIPQLRADDDMQSNGSEDHSSESEAEQERESASARATNGKLEATATADPYDPKTFSELGIIKELCEACSNLGYTEPTPIQRKAIPQALLGHDVIGLAETGSGKTAAYVLPILQALMDKPQALFGLILAPTRELAYQISQACEALGSIIAVRCTTLVGGMDMVPQAISLNKKPHLIVATPGRLLDHLENTRGFNLRNLKYLVLDEADRLLDLDFGQILDKILKNIPGNPPRKTYLFSATMTAKVSALQRASLKNPVHISISSDFAPPTSTLAIRDRSMGASNTTQTNAHKPTYSLPPSSLQQSYLFVPQVMKENYLVYLLSLSSLAGTPTIVFTRTINTTTRLALLLRNLGLASLPLHGKLPQSARLAALNRFRSQGSASGSTRHILVATDVAARGLDLPQVDSVINFDLPGESAVYVHRVGRTARAGKSGRSVSLVSQYDVEIWLRIENMLGYKLGEFEGGVPKEEVLSLGERVAEAQRVAGKEIRDLEENKKRRKKGRGGKEIGSGRRKMGRREDAEEE